MWSRIMSCFRRHRRKLFIVGGVLGGLTILNTYLRRKFLEWEAKRAVECIERLKRQSHFDGTLQTCDNGIIALIPKVRDTIRDTADVIPIVEELKTNPKNKRELWEELKIMVFVQVVGEVYAQCLLVVLIRVQLSILGGYMYSEFQKNKTSECCNIPSVAEDREKYLSHVSKFIVGGVKDLMIPVEDAIRKSFRGIQLGDNLTLQDFNNIFKNILSSMGDGNGNVIPNISQYLITCDNKDTNENEQNNQFLEKMVKETKDVLECSDCNKVLTSCLDHGMATLMDRVSECYMYLSNQEIDFMNPHSIAIPLAKLTPVMHIIFNDHQMDEQGALVHTLLQQESLKTFAANLYEAFSQEPV